MFITYENVTGHTMVIKSQQFYKFVVQLLNFWNVFIQKLPLFALIFFLAVFFYSSFFLIEGVTPSVYMLTFSFSFFSCIGVLYYNYNNKNLNVNTVDADTAINVSTINFKILVIIFVASIIFILFILHNVYYVKPNGYYILIGIAATSISLQIGLKKEVNN